MLYGVQCCHPTTVTLTHAPAFMQTEMSLIPGMVNREAAARPCDPRALYPEASVHRTDPAGQSALVHRSRKSVLPQGTFRRGAAFRKEWPTYPEGQKHCSLALPSASLLYFLSGTGKPTRTTVGGLLPVEYSF